MPKVSISQAWDESRAILGRDGKLIAPVALALIALPDLVLAVVGSPIANGASAVSRIVYIAAILLGIVAQVAINRLAIGPSTTVSDAITIGLVRLVPIFLVMAVAIISVAIVTEVVSLGLGAAGIALVKAPQQPTPALILVLMVLMMAVLAVTQLIFPVAAVETGNPVRLVSRSWNLARGNYWRLLGFVVTAVTGTALILMAVQLGFGTIVVLLAGRPDPGSISALLLGLISGLLQAGLTVVIGVTLARIYVQLSSHGAVHPSVPSSGT